MSDTHREAVKHDAGKAPMRFLGHVPAALEHLARVLEHGAAAHDEPEGVRNFMGLAPARLRDALGRHVVAYLSGQTVDPDSGAPELACILANAAMLLELEHGERG